MMLDDDLNAVLKKNKLPAWDKEAILAVFKVLKNKKSHNLKGIHDHFKGRYSRDEITRSIAFLQGRHFICIKTINMSCEDDVKQISFQMSPVNKYLQSLVNQDNPSRSRLF